MYAAMSTYTAVAAAVGQVLPCQRECSNTHDPYTVAVVDGARGVIVGHVLHSYISSVLLVSHEKRYNKLRGNWHKAVFS